MTAAMAPPTSVWRGRHGLESIRNSGGVGQVDLSDLAPTFLHLLDRPENPSLSGSPLDTILY